MRPEILFPYFAEVTSLKGVGPKVRPALERLIGGSRVLDLLLHIPMRYSDRRPAKDISSLNEGHIGSVIATVDKHIPPPKRSLPYRILMRDESGYLTLTFFRTYGDRLDRLMPVGEKRFVSGRVESYRGERQMAHPDLIMKPEEAKALPGFEPRYPMTSDIAAARLRQFVAQGLEMATDLPEWADKHFRASKNYLPFKEALQKLHMPNEQDMSLLPLHKERLAYDEAFARGLAFHIARRAARDLPSPIMPVKSPRVVELLRDLPFTPTAAQMRSYDEIAADMASNFRMNRMLQGDVGSGKTLVAALAAAQAADAGFMAAFMAPTELLARQQADALQGFARAAGLRVEALTGSDKGKRREALLMAIQAGEVHIVCGTQALYQSDVSFGRLGLIVVDEQHRFGVSDRLKLSKKGLHPHMLSMSATPIPRTLAQAAYGDLDMSVIDELPKTRKPITTRATSLDRIGPVTKAIAEAIKRGERAFWVCPRLDAQDSGESAVIARVAYLRSKLNAPIGLVHGRMKADEKDAALEAFRNGDTSLLLATTVVEVGVDVPEATIMVIEKAEMFGLAQLHQLRGRVGRGEKQSSCLLLYESPLSDEAKARIDIMRQTNDGFKIAELDLKQRGAGDVLGRQQSGHVSFKVLDVMDHSDLIEIAHKDTGALLEGDPNLQTERGRAARLALHLFAPPSAIKNLKS